MSRYLFRIFVASLFVLTALSAAVGVQAEDDDIILTGKVVPTVTRAATLPFNAVVKEVLVKPGDAVKAGSPVLRYYLQDEARRLLQKEITNGAGTESLKSQVLDTERQLATTIAERNKTRQLVSSGLGSRQALARQEDSVKALNNRIDLLNATIRKSELNFQSRLKELETYFGKPVKEEELLPDELVLTSPINGYVLFVEPTLSPDELLGAGAAPIQVGQLDPVLIQVPVYETDINNIKVGDTADIEIPSLGSRKFKGKISEISWISSDMKVSSPSYYTVVLEVPNSELLLKPGFKAIVSFSPTGN